MTFDLTPNSKSQKSSDVSETADQVPSTPKLPFDPPRRRSSLAFSKILDSPAAQELVQNFPHAISSSEGLPTTPQPNIGRKRTSEASCREPNPLPGPVIEFQKVFQTARANLQIDMHFAASPTGSIASRLPYRNQEPTLGSNRDNQNGNSARTWRYSTVPKIFAAPLSDVREPLPDASPILPILVSRQAGEHETAMEPTSSGFASPASEIQVSDQDHESVLPPLPQSSSPYSDPSKNEDLNQVPASKSYEREVSYLTQPMTGLKVGSGCDREEELLLDTMDESPVIEHLRRKSGHDHEMAEDILDIPDTIFLSQSAKAAAECARAKRGLLKEALDDDTENDNRPLGGFGSRSAALTAQKAGCPDPQLHHYMATHPCPDPFAHVVLSTPEGYRSNTDAFRAQPRAWGNEYFATARVPAGQHASVPVSYRTTAAGSPMPFARRNRGLAYPAEHNQMDRLHLISAPLPSTSIHNSNGNPQHASRHVQKPSEHFRPGWYYASEQPQLYDRPNTNLYSFSTAAAKATGESAAPDLRIRDSYRTDTLTPLARPQGRFRKNGLAATLRAPGSRAYHNRCLPPHFLARNAREIQPQHFDPPQFEHAQFRSSPPRPSTHYSARNVSRKRGANDLGVADYETTGDETAWPSRPNLRTYQSEELMRVDDQTRAAIRMSLFAPSTPDYQQSETESLREISPNVNIWRKGRAGQPELHYRKKRRPSYWDSDLEEVRMSPAGRAGIQSSPPISKRSVVAELENTSSYVGSVTVDSNSALHDHTDGATRVTEQTGGQDADMQDALSVSS